MWCKCFHLYFNVILWCWQEAKSPQYNTLTSRRLFSCREPFKRKGNSVETEENYFLLVQDEYNEHISIRMFNKF